MFSEPQVVHSGLWKILKYNWGIFNLLLNYEISFRLKQYVCCQVFWMILVTASFSKNDQVFAVLGLGLLGFLFLFLFSGGEGLWGFLLLLLLLGVFVVVVYFRGLWLLKKWWAIMLWKSGLFENLTPSVLFSFNSFASWESIGKISIPWQAQCQVTMFLAKKSLGMHNLSTFYLLYVSFFCI